ncbi:MAG: DUF1254 domain-containing protein [Myxococcota bacterium]
MAVLRTLPLIVTALILSLPAASEEIPPEVLQSLSTPDTVETSLGTLSFTDGAPSAETVETVYDHLDFIQAFRAFVDTFQGASLAAIRQGFLDVGVPDNEMLLFSELMDAKSVFLTANADTVYYLGFLDLTKGPMVFESPPGALGTIDDMWFRWVTDFGAPGPDRGEGGRYLILPPGYDGYVPSGGYFVARARTNRVILLGRSFMQDSDPKPTVATIKSKTRIYPYRPGSFGTPIAEFLAGEAALAKTAEAKPAVFHEGTGRVMNTVPPSDFGYYEILNDVVQSEPATALDPELMGPLAAIGIEKGKKFAPDARMKGILTRAAAVANATARTIGMRPRDPDWSYYPGSSWINALFDSGYLFETPIPEITRQGAKPFPPTGYRKMNARTWFFYYATGITPAMAMRMTDVGSQYLIAMLDEDKNYLDGSKTYKVTLPKGIPENKFWSFTLYDNQTRSMLDTPQRYPRAGSQSFPSPAAVPAKNGSTTIWFSPEQPEGVARGNWIQTDPNKGFFTILRLYSPLEPFFTKKWRPSEIERVD